MRHLRSPKLVRKRRLRTAKRIFFTVVFLVVFVGGPILVLRADFLNISNIKVEGATSISTDSIVEVARQRIEGNFLYVIPKSNIIIFPSNKIENDLLAVFPKLNNVSVNREFLKTIAVKVEERKPAFLWCQSGDKEQCYFTDSNGLIFEKSANFSTAPHFIFMKNIEGDPTGQRVFASEEMDILKGIISNLRSLGLAPSSLEMVSGEVFEIDVGGGKIIFSIRDDMNLALSNLASLLADKNLGLYGDGELQVRSIDLRYGNKIILKRQ